MYVCMMYVSIYLSISVHTLEDLNKYTPLIHETKISYYAHTYIHAYIHTHTYIHTYSKALLALEISSIWWITEERRCVHSSNEYV